MLLSLLTKTHPLNSCFPGEGSSRRDNVREALSQEKKEREHLLALNQVIAQQVMQKSRMVAGGVEKQTGKRTRHIPYREYED
jgi:hypothetical protein